MLIGILGKAARARCDPHMLVTQKCQYALRALFELALQGNHKPVKIALVAERQRIPFRFLEVILSQLKQGGFVESRRGTEGGYLLARRPEEITVGDIVRFIDGPQIEDEQARLEQSDPPGEVDLFGPIWDQARAAVFQVFDGLSLADLLAQYEASTRRFVPNYVI